MRMLLSVLAVIIVLLIFYIRLYNRLRRLSIKVREAGAGIDVALEKRYDMLSEELEAVKKFLQHEHQIYTEVTAIRTGKELEEAAFQEKKALSEDAVRTISDTIAEQQEQMQEIRRQLDLQHGRDGAGAGEGMEAGDGGLSGQQMSLDRKLSLLTSVQQGLTGVTSSINALSEQYPALYSYISVNHFQRDIFDAEEHLQAARRLYNSNVSLYNQKLASFPWLIVARLHGMKEAAFYEVEEKKKNFQVRF
ncbi:MAG TPA: LemA family protein [Candidatus Eisenbergiella merdipullorum]|uniref:LemA family protein n=1 Tax=Candidatus Eisenbergiella merdipullorum TaxID=2838553 RepID=A0A9D2I8J5_9FIRM|nr:LemA family protein [Candidatus Eisenbergiella merdipullorum]